MEIEAIGIKTSDFTDYTWHNYSSRGANNPTQLAEATRMADKDQRADLILEQYSNTQVCSDHFVYQPLKLIQNVSQLHL